MATRDDDHLARMRVEYGSVEKDGSGDLDADWLADGWVALLRKWLADAEHAGVAEPNAMVVGTVDARGRPVDPLGAVQERGRTAASRFFTNYDSAKGEDTGRDALRVGDVPLVPARQAGPRPRPGDQGVGRADRRLLVQASARFAAGRVGVAPVRTDRLARRAARAVGRRDSSDSPTSTRSRCRRTGAGT